MKRMLYLSQVIVIFVSCLFAGNECGAEAYSDPKDEESWGKTIDWDKIRSENEAEMERYGPPMRMLKRLPNFECGAGRPQPDYLNFYEVEDRFPGYLMCEYMVNDKHYTILKEPIWFEKSLAQIRELGSEKFPPVKWIVVMITNRAEANKAPSPYPPSCKVAAVFKADEVFDSSRDLSQLIAQAKKDRKPFMYDKSQPTPGEQQRWLIVERHYPANRSQEDIDAEKKREEILKQIRFPCYVTKPLPNYKSKDRCSNLYHVNYYKIDADYPEYLLCKYVVNEENYKQTDEPKWFEDALTQVRRLGRKEFPPLKWVAVIVHNRADAAKIKEDYLPIESSFRAGAVFNAGNVFNPSYNLSLLINRTPVDRQPFIYAQEGWLQNRWMVVERHAAINRTQAELEEAKKRNEKKKPVKLEFKPVFAPKSW